MYDAGEHEDIASIKNNPIAPTVKGKILSLYFPDRYLNIFAEWHLHHFLNKLSISFDKDADPVDLREKLINYKKTDPKYANITAIKFGIELYHMFPMPASIEEAQSNPSEELYESDELHSRHIVFKNVPKYSDSPETCPEQIFTSYGQVYKIDPRMSARAIIDANYSCEVNENHESFLRKNGQHIYTEAHHLIPRSHQNKFQYSLDVPANIISLCSNCHNWLHYGADFEKILKVLYDKRIERLKKTGLDISFAQLKEYY